MPMFYHVCMEKVTK